jgi:hypothetical protein
MTGILAAILPLIQIVVKNYPDIKEGLKNLFNKPDPTDADWDALRAKVLAKKYEDYVPSTRLPPDGP